jgi:hypothetical protein
MRNLSAEILNLGSLAFSFQTLSKPRPSQNNFQPLFFTGNFTDLRFESRQRECKFPVLTNLDYIALRIPQSFFLLF